MWDAVGRYTWYGLPEENRTARMSLKSKIEAVIYASEEPVTLQQLVGLLADEAGAELDQIASGQASLPLGGLPAAPGENAEEGRTGGREQETAREDAQVPSPQRDDAGAEDPDPENPVSPAEEATPTAPAETDAERRRTRDRERAVRDHVRRAVDVLIHDYAEDDRGIEIREVANGFRMGTKPEYHDAVRGFVKSLKPALRLTLPALETLAVVAYKQPVTAAEISEIRGVDSAGVLGGLMARKLISTAGRKQVIGRPMLYKTTRDFLLRFGLKDVQELPSMEEFERMAGELAEQEDLPMEHADTIIERANARGDAEHILQDEQAHDANATASEVFTADDETAANEIHNQQATAETAAGGNHDEHAQPHRQGSTEAETLHPTEDGQHGRTLQADSDDTGSRQSDGSKKGYQAGQG